VRQNKTIIETFLRAAMAARCGESLILARYNTVEPEHPNASKGQSSVSSANFHETTGAVLEANLNPESFATAQAWKVSNV